MYGEGCYWVGESLLVLYMCIFIVEVMVGGVVTYFKQIIPDGVDVNTTTRQVNIYP